MKGSYHPSLKAASFCPHLPGVRGQAGTFCHLPQPLQELVLSQEAPGTFPEQVMMESCCSVPTIAAGTGMGWVAVQVAFSRQGSEGGSKDAAMLVTTPLLGQERRLFSLGRFSLSRVWQGWI